MKNLTAFWLVLLLSEAAFSQPSYHDLIQLPHPERLIDSLPPNTETIALPPANYWRIVMPGVFHDRATFHLVRAEGCWLELSESQKEAEALEKQIENLKVQNVLLLKADDLTEKIETNVETMQKRTKWARFWQNVGQWIKDKTNAFIAMILGLVAAGEAVYIVYLTVGF